jgi:hypothetical protein
MPVRQGKTVFCPNNIRVTSASIRVAASTTAIDITIQAPHLVPHPGMIAVAAITHGSLRDLGEGETAGGIIGTPAQSGGGLNWTGTDSSICV